MRAFKWLAFCAFAALLAVPPSADARSRFGRGIIGIATAPLRVVTRAVPGLSGSRFRQRRAMSARAHARPAVTRAAAVDRGTAADRSREDEEAKRAQQPAAAAAASDQPFNAYEDLLGYALWPDDYAAAFWARGYGDVMRAVAPIPAAAMPSTVGSDARTTRRARTKLANAGDAPVANSAPAPTGMCGAQAEAQAARPLDRIAQTIQLNDSQRTSLEVLRTALREAIARGKSACLEAMPAAPSARLKVASNGLWAIRDADILFRTPLVNFYATLSEEQKQKFAQRTSAGDAANKDGSKDDGKGAALPCAQAANDLPVGAIEQSVQPSQDQRASLEMLRGFSTEMSAYLAASCPQQAPPDPVARLDAAGNRVEAMLYAVMLFDQALNGFYGQLSDEQKKKFDAVRRAQ